MVISVSLPLALLVTEFYCAVELSIQDLVFQSKMEVKGATITIFIRRYIYKHT